MKATKADCTFRRQLSRQYDPTLFHITTLRFAQSHQSQKLSAEIHVRLENANCVACCRDGARFLDSPHHHAGVLGLHYHEGSPRLDCLHHGAGHFPRQALLDLQSPSIHFDDARQFGQADDSAGRDVSQVNLDCGISCRVRTPTQEGIPCRGMGASGARTSWRFRFPS